MTLKFRVRNRSVILYGLSLAMLLLLLKWLEWRIIIIDHAFDLYAGIIALLFMSVGILLSNKLTRPVTNTVIVEKQVYITKNQFVLNKDEIARLCISKRELQVLQLMAHGLSNQQIAEQLFVSLNTIKTHCSRIFEKLEVKRRTQAVEMARDLHIIP